MAKTSEVEYCSIVGWAHAVFVPNIDETSSLQMAGRNALPALPSGGVVTAPANF
jgi:hypothetical protein